MTKIYLILFVLLTAVIVATTKLLVNKILSRTRTGEEPFRFPYEKQYSLFTAAERAFLKELERAAGDACRIFGKIRLADIINVRSGLSGSERQGAFNRIQSKHVDFLVCRKDDLSIIGVVELDDDSHRLPDRRGRDKFIDRALEAAGLPIVHWPLKRKRATGQLAEKLSETFGPALPGGPDWSHLFRRKTEYDPAGRPRSSESAEGDRGKDCPACGARLEKCRVKRGRHAGRLILVCSRYPECKHFQPCGDGEKASNGAAGPAFDPPCESSTEAESARARFKF